MMIKISQDGGNVLCCVVRSSQQQGEDLHGFRLDAEGYSPGGLGPGVPRQLHQVRQGGVEADGRGDSHSGCPLYSDHGPSWRGLHPRNDKHFLSQFYPTHSSNLNWGVIILFVSEMKCLSAQPWARCCWMTLHPPPRLPGVTRLSTATRQRFATKSEVWSLERRGLTPEYFVSECWSLFSSWRNTDRLRQNPGRLRGNVWIKLFIRFSFDDKYLIKQYLISIRIH